MLGLSMIHLVPGHDGTAAHVESRVNGPVIPASPSLQGPAHNKPKNMIINIHVENMSTHLENTNGRPQSDNATCRRSDYGCRCRVALEIQVGGRKAQDIFLPKR